MSEIVDLAFPVSGTKPIAADHGYALYGAISRTVPELHELSGIGIHPIGGTQIGNRQLMLTDRRHLVIRCSAEQIPTVIALSGKSLRMAAASIRLGVPQVRALQPTTSLRSRLVTIKLANGELTAESFLATAKQQLASHNVSEQVVTTLGKRRTVRIKDKEVVGYETIIEGLSAEESLTLLENGLGGRRKMGCGFFVGLR